MGARKPIYYLGAALAFIAIGAAANVEALGLGRASGSKVTDSSESTDSAFPGGGINAFSNGKRENLDFAFYEEFLGAWNQDVDEFIADKTGEWSKASLNTRRRTGETPGLQRVAQTETVFAKPSPVHDSGSIGTTGGGSLPPGDLFGAAFFSGAAVNIPGLLPGGFSPDVTPPVSEVPIPPPAILFVSAIAGFAFARRFNRG